MRIRRERGVQCSWTERVNNARRELRRPAGLGSRYHRKRLRRGDACDETYIDDVSIPFERRRRGREEGSSLRMHVAGHGAWNTLMVKRRALHNVRIGPRRTMDATARRRTGSTYRNAEHPGIRGTTSRALLTVGIFAVADSRCVRCEAISEGAEGPLVLARAENGRIFRSRKFSR